MSVLFVSFLIFSLVTIVSYYFRLTNKNLLLLFGIIGFIILILRRYNSFGIISFIFIKNNLFVYLYITVFFFILLLLSINSFFNNSFNISEFKNENVYFNKIVMFFSNYFNYLKYIRYFLFYR